MSRLAAEGELPVQQFLVDERRYVTQPWLMVFQALLRRKTLIEDTHANRLASHAASQSRPGTWFYETDRNVYYQCRIVSGVRTWMYAAGTMRGTFADVPSDLGTEDEGFPYEVTTGTGSVEYYHVARWTGSEWEATGDWGGYFAHFALAPQEKGWQLCDGTTTSQLIITGGSIAETAFTVPDEVTDQTYRKAGAAYAGVAPAVAPGITGDTEAVSAGTPTGTNDAPTFTGSLGTTNNSGSGSVASGAGASASGNHSHSFTPAGAVSAPGFTGDPLSTHDHGVGSLEVDDTGEPAHITAIPYFRR
jgi:hypothetical protein